MKPRITESAIDGVMSRTLGASKGAIQACLTAAMSEGGLPQYDRVTIARQVRHRDTHGTADLVLSLWLGDIQEALILIENKIDAGFTPDQPQRYGISRNAHRRDRTANRVATLLISPLTYITSSRLKDYFDGTLPYESLLPFADQQDGALVELAIERASSPYEPIPVEAVMNFFDGYAATVGRGFPDLVIKSNPNSANARPKASRTIYFDARASGFRRYTFLLKGAKPASVRISHQCWDSGAASPSVKLMLDGWACHISGVAPILKPALSGSGIYIRSAGRSLALVADTKRLDNMRAASGQRATIEDALQKLQRIRDTWNSMEGPLSRAASAARS